MEQEEILNAEEAKEETQAEEKKAPKKKKSSKKTGKKKAETTKETNESEAVEEIIEATETVPEETKEEEKEATVEENIEETVDETVEDVIEENETETTEDTVKETTEAEEIVRENIEAATKENTNCPYCGKEIPVVAKHCPYCGKALGETAVSANKKKKTFIGLAAAAVIVLAVLLFAVPAIQKSNKYKNSLQLLSDGNYLEAADSFRELEGYKDSDDYVVYCTALDFFAKGDLEKAISRFESVNELADADRYISYISAIQAITEDDSVSSYSNAKDLFTKADKLLDSEGMIRYCEAVLSYLNEKDGEALNALTEVLDAKAINENYLEAADDISRFLTAKGLFDNDDYSGLDEFKTLASEGDRLVSSQASDYADYIEGKQYYEQELYYSASSCFGRCYGFKDADELAESCYQERPSSGIVYRNTSSSSVSVTIYDTKDDEDMFVKIYDSNDTLVESLYIRDGASATAYFQGGRFRMAIATGESDYWYGPKEAFGNMGTYQRLLLTGSNEYYDFPGGNSFTLKFNVSNGNVNHKASNYGDF